jgi:hypothetical protein
LSLRSQQCAARGRSRFLNLRSSKMWWSFKFSPFSGEKNCEFARSEKCLDIDQMSGNVVARADLDKRTIGQAVSGGRGAVQAEKSIAVAWPLGHFR